MRVVVGLWALAWTLACAGAPSSDNPLDARACRQYDSCGVQAYDVCMAEALTIDNDPLKECLAASSCSELASGATTCTSGGLPNAGFGDGSGCAARGVQDCPFMKTCCAPQGGTQQIGYPGRCIDIAICNYPTGR